MSDNLLEIGISVQLADLQTGMQEAVATVEAATSQMMASFQEFYDQQGKVAEMAPLPTEANDQTLIRKLALYDRDSEEYQKLLSKQQQMHQQYELERQRVDRQEAALSLQTWTRLGESIERGFRTSISGMIRGTQTLSQNFARMGETMVISFAEWCAQIVEKWISTQLLLAAINTIFGTNFGASSKQEAAATASSNATQATSAAFLGAANAYAFNAWNPPEALAAAATALAVGLSFAAGAGAAGAASAAGGWDNVPSTAFAILHPQEMVLSAPYATGLRHMIDSMSSTPAKSLGSPISAVGQPTADNEQSRAFGGITVPVSVNVSAMDGESINRVAGSLGGRIGNQVMARVRRYMATKGVMG